MFKVKFAGTVALIAAMLCFQARASAAAVPPKSVSADTVAVIHLSSTHFNPDTLKTAAKVVLGANAAQVDAPLAKFKDGFDKAIAAGVHAATIIVTDSKGDKPSVAVYFHLKPDADPAAVQKAVTADMSEQDRAKSVFVQQGTYLVMFEKESPLPTVFDDARAQTFTDALATIETSALQIAFIPNAHTKEEILKAQAQAPMQGLKDAAAVLANCKWTTTAINLGDTPGLSSTINAADAAGAKQLADGINAGLDDLKKKASDPNGPMALFGPLIGGLIESLRPVTNGTQVTVALKGQTLIDIANFAANFGLLKGH